MKKKVVIIISIILVFSVIFTISYVSVLRQDKYIQNWSIELPKDMQSIYHKNTDSGFHGDGIYYDMFKLKEYDDFFHNYNSEKNQSIEKKITDNLELLNVENDKYPNFTKKYYWKYMEKNYADKLWIIYYPQDLELYVIQELS